MNASGVRRIDYDVQQFLITGIGAALLARAVENAAQALQDRDWWRNWGEGFGGIFAAGREIVNGNPERANQILDEVQRQIFGPDLEAGPRDLEIVEVAPLQQRNLQNHQL